MGGRYEDKEEYDYDENLLHTIAMTATIHKKL
jgi:hypothetical protein